jgi:hypothetical protein
MRRNCETVRSVVAVLILLAAGCGGSSGSTNNNPPPPTGITIDPTVSGPLAANLSALAPTLSGTAPLAVGAAAVALAGGVQATRATSTAASLAPMAGRSPALNGATPAPLLYGLQLTVLNAPPGGPNQVFTGVAAFEDTMHFAVVMGPATSPTPVAIPPAAGVYVAGSTTPLPVWLATAGGEIAQLQQTLGACGSIQTTILPFATACNFATFGSNSMAEITASTPIANGATGSQTTNGKLTVSSTLFGAAITVDCGQSGLPSWVMTACQALTPGNVAVSINPTTVTLPPGGTQQFTTAVTGTANPAVTWSVRETSGGGSVSRTGFYIAPVTAGGPFHVVATSVADASKSAVATVTVASSSAPGAVFVVDSTGYLSAFDGNGNLQARAQLPGTVSDINGGEVALANGNVYVTLGQPTDRVVAFTQSSLAPVSPSAGAFSGLFVPRGITYDTNADRFYVGNGGSTVTVYDQNGASVATTGGFPGHYGPSGMAFDAENDSIWAANYAGYSGAPYGVADYTENGGAAQTFDLTTKFVSPNAHTEPYSIAFCPGSCAAGKVWVGFIDDGSRQGTPVVAGYGVDGTSSGVTFSVTKPYQLDVDAQTYVWVADKGGLFKYGLGGSQPPAGFAAHLTPPIYGVATLAGTPSAGATISPSAIFLQPGATQQFTATTTWSSSGSIAWSVQEANGGSVSTTGLYTAPSTVGGPFHVVATTSTGASAVATVTVALQGSVFIVDSTGYLLSFDANGVPITKVQLPGTVSDINGGEVALANGNVYVTLGQATNQVVAYTQIGLQRVSLASGAFSGLFVPRGIAFDSHAQRFYVGNGGASVNVYDQNGLSVAVTGGFPGHYGPSGVAFDGDDDTLWVANYAGYASAPYGTAEYNEDGSATHTFNLSTQFVSPYPSSEPYSIAWCPGNCGASNPKVWIGFIDDGSGHGTPTVQAYTPDGSPVAGFQLPMVKPYQVAFDSMGNPWVADKGGIWQVSLLSGNIAPDSMKAALKPPIYGVAAR